MVHLRNKHGNQVHPDGEVGQPAEFLECANLAENYTDESEDEETDDEADGLAGTLGDLSDRLTHTEDEGSEC